MARRLRSRVIAASFAFAASLALVACVNAPDPTPKPSPTADAAPRPKPSQTPVPEPVGQPAPPEFAVSDVTHITVRPEHLDLGLDDGTVIGTLSYDADVDSFVGTLSEVLGGSPSVEELPGGHEWVPSTRYLWPGVEVRDDHEPDGVEIDMNVSVTFTHPIVADGVGVSTVQGFQPGDSLRAFADELGETWHDSGFDQFPAETGPELGPQSEWYDRADANAVSVQSWAARTDTSVTSVIHAPWNFGIGHV